MSSYRIEIYKAADGWRWRLKAGNGRIVADSGEAYTRRPNAVRAVCKALRLPLPEKPSGKQWTAWLGRGGEPRVSAVWNGNAVEIIQWSFGRGVTYDLVEVAR